MTGFELIIGLALALFLVGCAAAYILWILYLDSSRRAVYDELIDDQVYFTVTVPRDNEYEIANAEQMFAALYALF